MSQAARKNTVAFLFITILAVLALWLSGMAEGFGVSFSSVAHANPAGIKFLGVGSCGGSGCHSEDIKTPKPDKDIGHDENTIWEKFDLHARACTDQITKNRSRIKGLGNEKSKSIIKKLGIADATTSERCSSCHMLSGFSNAETKTRIPLNYANDVGTDDFKTGRFKPTHGVSCDGCHGPSEKYLQPHRTKGWAQTQRQTLSGDALYDQTGFYDTKNLKLRANMCVSCHLKIEPDLIAAGHPELPFELDSFCHGTWMHWRQPGDYQGAKAWAMGQFVCLREAALQLSDRIKAGDKIEKGLVLDSYKQLAAHAIMARHPAQLISADMETEIDKELASVHTNWNDSAKVTASLRTLGQLADSLADKLGPMKIDGAMAEKMASGIAAEGEAAGKKGFRAAQQYTFAMSSLWETNFLKGSAPDLDRIALDKRMKDLPQSQKIRALFDEVDESDKYNGANFVKAAQEVMAAFPGGKVIPLPDKAPDSLMQNGDMPAAMEKKPDVPVAEPKKVVTPPEVIVVAPPDEPKKVVVPPVIPPAAKNDVPPEPVKVPEKAPTITDIKPAADPNATPKEQIGKFIYCPECGRKNPADYKYCPRCGHAVPKLEE